MTASRMPLLIATVNFHVGHAIALHVAAELGYYADEGLDSYYLRDYGIAPAIVEPVALDTIIHEQGIDIAAGASASAAIRRSGGSGGLKIVGIWRIDGPAGTRWYTSRPDATLESLSGARIGVRTMGDMEQAFVARALRRAGINPDVDVEWVCDPRFYVDEVAKLGALTAGSIDVVGLRGDSQQHAHTAGFQMVLDSGTFRSGLRPGKVTLAPQEVIDSRGDEVVAFLAALTRTFWFMRDPGNFDTVRQIELGLRAQTHNAEERSIRLVTSPEVLERWPLPIDLRPQVGSLAAVAADLAATGDIPASFDVTDVVAPECAQLAWQQLSGRPSVWDGYRRAEQVQTVMGY
jgi:ABC-type nitrate/sulfonate/bicarbonate transport system substrate-binding protein